MEGVAGDDMPTPQAPQGGVLEMCKNHWKSLVFLHWHPQSPANGFLARKRFPKILQTALKNEAKQQFWGRKRLRFLGRALGTPPGKVWVPMRTH